MMVESVLKLIKSDWCIYIWIESKVVPAETFQVEIAKDLRIQLDEDELSLLRSGIASLWNDKPEAKTFHILVTKIQFNPCDYQKEGLYWVGRNLGESILDLPASKPEYGFDKAQNRYRFWIPCVQD